MDSKAKKSLLGFVIPLLLFAGGIVALVSDGATGRDAISVLCFVAAGVTAAKMGFGKLPQA